MNYLIVCNTGSDSISKIPLIYNVNEALVSKELVLKKDREMGPIGICVNNNISYIANNYDNSISIMDIELEKETDILYVGSKPNDLIEFKNYLYVVCSESNTLVMFDAIEKKAILDIKLNSWPYNLDINYSLNLIFVSNFQSDNISVIDTITNKVIRDLEVFEYPTKIKVSKDNKYLYVCESYMGDDKNGFIEIFDLSNFYSIKRIEVGKVPIDIYEENNIIYVANLESENITLINKENLTKITDLYVGGMPKNIVKYRDVIYVSDYLNGRLICINLKGNNRKSIAIGKEPNAMILY